MSQRPAGQPDPVEPRTLAWATAISLLLASVGLAVVILPSSYGIDPTGVGEALGFEPPPETGSLTMERNDTFEIRLRPNQSLEFKLYVQEGDGITYAWNTSANLTYELHGEPEDPDASFHSYEKGEGEANSGSLTAPFTGSHGWYWKNPTNRTVSINLSIEGTYAIEGIR